jgi:hypothetical protein
MPYKSEYLPNRSDYTDIPIRPRPDEEFKHKRGKDWVICPSCDGHGLWNLLLNEYGPGRRFQASCNNCNGWGWVEAGSPDAKCVHQYKEVANPRMCEHIYECEKCKHRISVDSSD